jgi:hypothetical protein
MYRIGAVRVGQMSAWQALQNSRIRRAQFASDQAVMSAINTALYSAQLNQSSGLASLTVNAALTRIQSEQRAKANLLLSQASSALNQSSSSSSSTPSSPLNLVA